ncbi:hypothetical protein EUX98_g988 [Antrodiella citrinella]|uniref:Enoyl reductase (ER) domain-containing protein n=1 Tax=Antrodiella citrinella TaxID=2447956 RepID=A0A4S4N5Q3_9APHY|nr:hypothetical protein EUX98_g988 [Antrodiella citrinella]
MVIRGQFGAKGIVPCADGAGEVIAIGDRVTKWKVGDRVLANLSTGHLHGDMTPEIQATALGVEIDGTLTEYKMLPAESLVSIPDHLTFEQAATLPCAAVTAWNALNGPTPVKGGDYVLVQGTGGVSLFGIQLAHAIGATVIATSSTSEKLEVATKLGADFVINYKETPDWELDVLDITGRGAHHIIEVGGPNTLLKSIKAVRHAGWIHNIGFLAGSNSDVNPSEITSSLLRKGVIFRGILMGSVSQFEDMNRLISSHKIVPVVDKVFEFDQVKDAYKYYLESQNHVGKIVIRVAST